MMIQGEITPAKCDYLAECFVNGMVDEVIKGGVITGKKIPNAGGWHLRFHGHPWVEEAEADGWGPDLRSAVKAIVWHRLAQRQSLHDINELMPSLDWVEHRRQQAKRYAAAKAWRNEIIEKHGSVDAFLSKTKGGGDAKPLGSVTRDAFEEMQRNSQNKAMHMTKEGIAKLTERSRRMSGDDE